MNPDKLKPRIKIRSVGSRHVVNTRQVEEVSGITLHTPDGRNVYEWFMDPRSRAASHAFVGMDGVVESYYDYRCVLPANSSPWANRHTISIEFADNGNPEDSVRTNALYEQGGKYIAYLIVRFNMGRHAVFNTNIFLHKQFNKGKSCPAGLDYERLIRVANKYLTPYFFELDKEEREEAKLEEQVVLADQVTNLPVKNNEMSKFTSRKFLLTLCAVALGLLQGYLLSTGKGEILLEPVYALIGAYITAEGVADVATRINQGKEIYSSIFGQGGKIE